MGARVTVNDRGEARMDKVAVVGAGLIGRAWSMVFARAGLSVSLWDKMDGVAEGAMGLIAGSLADLHAAGLVQGSARGDPRPHHPGRDPGGVRRRRHPRAGERPGTPVAQAGAVRRARPALPARGGAGVARPRGIPASEFTGNLPGRGRCLVAHPVNPPYLVPLVELVGAPWTDPAVVTRTRALMDRVGQVPVVAFKETTGFVLNRLQAALVAEAFRMVRDGVMSAADVDACVKDGLGLRWSFMGPFETIDLNAPGGVEDYVGRFGPLMGGITAGADALRLRRADGGRRDRRAPRGAAAGAASRTAAPGATAG